MNPLLSEFARNITSQCGEDGILAEIFNRLGTKSKVCVEFGAWDGKVCSNTWTLWHDQGWKAYLIECHPERFLDLSRTVADFPEVTPLQSLVEPAGEKSIDNILRGAGCPEEIDLLSVDIDGDEYYILDSIRWLKPRVIVVEYNATIPPHLDLVQKRGGNIGSSMAAMVRLADSKGFSLVACTQSNLILVDAREFPKLKIPPQTIEAVFPREALTCVISSYDGNLHLSRRPLHVVRLDGLTSENLRRASREPLRHLFDDNRIIPIRVFAERDIIFKPAGRRRSPPGLADYGGAAVRKVLNVWRGWIQGRQKGKG